MPRLLKTHGKLVGNPCHSLVLYTICSGISHVLAFWSAQLVMTSFAAIHVQKMPVCLVVVLENNVGGGIAE